MKRNVRLYNILFPMWMFWLWPTPVWLIILPANFVIDSLVLLAAMKWKRIADWKNAWRKSIVKVWLLGFLSD
ncbi:MAG: hypothetical protein Q4D42_11555, partial [Eubacteriales bacterium]|nr:hypothetical protein [Eubacteriales bacterium]